MREMSASEPLVTHRNALGGIRTGVVLLLQEECGGNCPRVARSCSPTPCRSGLSPRSGFVARGAVIRQARGSNHRLRPALDTGGGEIEARRILIESSLQHAELSGRLLRNPISSAGDAPLASRPTRN